MNIFLERMLNRECTEEEFRRELNHAKWRVESGREDDYLRREYLHKFPDLDK